MSLKAEINGSIIVITLLFFLVSGLPFGCHFFYRLTDIYYSFANWICSFIIVQSHNTPSMKYVININQDKKGSLRNLFLFFSLVIDNLITVNHYKGIIKLNNPFLQLCEEGCLSRCSSDGT